MYLKNAVRLIVFACVLFSCSVNRQQSVYGSFPTRYALKSLPDSWKNPGTLKALDEILPATITQLKNAQSCMSCDAGYNVTVHLDSLFLVDQTAISKKAFSWGKLIDVVEYICTFRFKSHLSVSDTSGTEIARLVVADPNEDVFKVRGLQFEPGRRSSLWPSRTDRGNIVRVALVPTDNELLHFTRDKVKIIQKRIREFEASAK